MNSKYFDKPWKIAVWIAVLYLIAEILFGRIFRFLGYYIGEAYIDYALLILGLIILAIVSFETGKVYIKFTRKKMARKLRFGAAAYFALIYAVKFIVVDAIPEAGSYSLLEDAVSLVLFSFVYAFIAYISLTVSNR